MNIFVKSCNVNQNWGDAAMLHATIQRFARICDDCTITLLEASPEFESAYQHLGLASVKRPEYTSWTRERRIWDKLNDLSPQGVDYLATSWPRLIDTLVRAKMKLQGRDPAPRNSFLDRFRSADALVVSGGGFITDVFPEPAENVLHLIMLAHQHEVPVFMFGQGVGPLTNPGLRSKARRALPHVELIAARERLKTVPVLHSLGVSPDRIHVTGDDAIGAVPPPEILPIR